MVEPPPPEATNQDKEGEESDEDIIKIKLVGEQQFIKEEVWKLVGNYPKTYAYYDVDDKSESATPTIVLPEPLPSGDSASQPGTAIPMIPRSGSYLGS